MPVDEQRRERERLGLAPVDAALVERVAPPLELLHELRVRREALGDAQQLLVERRAAGRPATAVTTLLAVAGGRCGRRCGGWRIGAPNDSFSALVRRLAARVDDLAARARPPAPAVTTPSATSSRRELLAHRRVRRRSRRPSAAACTPASSCSLWPMPAVADEVDDDVVAEPRAIREREPDRRERRLRVVGVDVDDRHVEALREVARVARRAAARAGRS